MSVVERKAPQTVNYRDVLPLAIPSSSNRRQFLPVNGSAFSYSGSNIIRIDVNADSMLDTQHSYLQFTLKNTAAVANTSLACDEGIPWISRLRIESGGVTLEDINEYGRLYALLQNAQMSVGKNACENSLVMGNNDILESPAAAAANFSRTPYTKSYKSATLADFEIARRVGGVAGALNGVPTAIIRNAQQTFCCPLFSGILNCDKYIPLILMNAGITIELTLQRPNLIGITDVAGAVGVTDYEISDCRYCAHLVDMDRNFYDALRGEMALTGSLAIHGQTWRHFNSQISEGAGGSQSLNIPARMKSIKSIFSTFRGSTLTSAEGSYSTSVFQRCAINGWQYRIGSVYYPQAQIPCGVTATDCVMAPTCMELLKAFGKVGDVVSDANFGAANFNQGNACDAVVGKSNLQTFAIGYDLEAFQRSALESGIDTANRALPISLELSLAIAPPAGSGGITCDSYCVADAFFYVNADGTMTPST